MSIESGGYFGSDSSAEQPQFVGTKCKKYIDFVDSLNDNLDKRFEFEVRVTWDKYDDPEYILFNIKKIIARDKHDAEQKGKDLFTEEIMGGKNSERKYLTAYVINYLNAPLI